LTIISIHFDLLIVYCCGLIKYNLDNYIAPIPDFQEQTDTSEHRYAKW